MAKHKQVFDLTKGRISELRRLLTYRQECRARLELVRQGNVGAFRMDLGEDSKPPPTFAPLPITDYLLNVLDEIALHLKFAMKQSGATVTREVLRDRLEVTTARRAPFATAPMYDRAVDYAMKSRRLLKADPLAGRLDLTWDERERCGIRTIGVAGVTKAARKKRQKEKKRVRDRQRQAAKRLAAGCMPRDQWRQQSESAAAPWLAYGVTDRTWRRWKKAGRIPACPTYVAPYTPLRGVDTVERQTPDIPPTFDLPLAA